MATLNLTKVGGLVLVEYTGRNDRIISASNPALEIDMPADGTSKVGVTLAGRSYSLSAITDIQVEGEAVTDQSDLLTKIATVFPEANGGAGGPTPNIDAVLEAGNIATSRDMAIKIGSDNGAFFVINMADENKVVVGLDAGGLGFINLNDKAVVVTEYLKYTAILNQTSTDAPTVVAILGANTVGDIVWTYSDVGLYIGTLTGAFLANKTICPNPIGVTEFLPVCLLGRQTDNQVGILNTDADGLSAEIEADFFVEIRVYP